nr:hypothetical protein [Paenibacillus larvae]
MARRKFRSSSKTPVFGIELLLIKIVSFIQQSTVIASGQIYLCLPVHLLYDLVADAEQFITIILP